MMAAAARDTDLLMALRSGRLPPCTRPMVCLYKGGRFAAVTEKIERNDACFFFFVLRSMSIDSLFGAPLYWKCYYEHRVYLYRFRSLNL